MVALGLSHFAFRPASVLGEVVFAPYFPYNIILFLQICLLHMHDANLQFYHIKVLCWIEIWWLRKSFESTYLFATFRKPVRGDQSFMMWHVFLLEVAISGWLHYNHKGMDIHNHNKQYYFDSKQPKVFKENICHVIMPSLTLLTGEMQTSLSYLSGVAPSSSNLLQGFMSFVFRNGWCV